MKKQIAILGSTGSIGTQALDVVRSHPDLFGIEVLTAQSNCDLLIRQAVEFGPNAVVIGDETCYEKVAEGLKDHPVKVFAGEEAIAQVVEMEGIDIVLNALVGYSGHDPRYPCGIGRKGPGTRQQGIARHCRRNDHGTAKRNRAM